MRYKNSLVDDTISKMNFILRYGGFNFIHNDGTFTNKKHLLIYLINFFWLNIDLCGAYYWFVDGVRNGKDFLELTYIAPCISLSTLATIKGAFMIFNTKNVIKLVDNLRNLENKDKKRLQSTEKDLIIEKERNYLHRVIKMCKWLYIIVDGLFGISPLIIMSVTYYNTGVMDRILPFMVLYPFDPFQVKVWPWVYMHQLWSETIVSLDICTADFFFYICCTYIGIQFKLLRHHIENLIAVQSNDQFIEDEEFKAKFRDIVKWHQDLYESVQSLENIYSLPTLLNFLSSSLTICLTGFNVAMVKDNTPFVLTFLSFLAMSLFQIFFLCIFADLLSSSSTEINDAVYKSQWLMAERKVGKKLLIMQIRAQKSCKLTAFGYADVNLNSFMRVLSSAWSYFALLQTIYGGSNDT